MFPLDTAFVLPTTFAVLLIMAAVLTPLHDVLPMSWRVAVLLVAVAGCGCLGRARDLAVITALGWAFLDGFVVNTNGTLDWRTPADLGRIAALALAASIGLAIGRLARRAHGGKAAHVR